MISSSGFICSLTPAGQKYEVSLTNKLNLTELIAEKVIVSQKSNK